MTLITSTIPPERRTTALPGDEIRMDQDPQRPVDHLDDRVTVVLTIGIGVIATATEANRWSHASLSDRLSFDPTNLSLTGLLLGQLPSDPRVLAISAEYGTGPSGRAWRGPEPEDVPGRQSRRLRGVALVVGEIVSFGAFFVGQMLIGGGAPTPPSTIGRAQRGRRWGLYLAVLGLLASGSAPSSATPPAPSPPSWGAVDPSPADPGAAPVIPERHRQVRAANIGNAMTVTNSHVQSGTSRRSAPGSGWPSWPGTR